MKRICDIPEEHIYPGLKVKGLKTGIIGHIFRIDRKDDNYAWILWEGEKVAYSGFYGNDCQCEVVEDLA